MICSYGICDECQKSKGCDYCKDSIFIPDLFMDSEDKEDGT